MKKLIMSEFLHKMNARKSLRKKIILFAAAAAFGLLMTMGLMVWGLISGASYLAAKTQEVNVSEKIESLKNEIHALPALTNMDCWQNAEGLLSVRTWLEHSISDNLTKLKTACLKKETQGCEGDNCKSIIHNQDIPENGETV